jgi:hypothetical protein
MRKRPVAHRTEGDSSEEIDQSIFDNRVASGESELARE